MICPRCGAAIKELKLGCEACLQAISTKAMEQQQAQFIHVIVNDSAPLTVIQMFPKGTLDRPSWHIQRFGERRRTLCGAYIRSFKASRQTLYSRLGDLKPICEGCDEKLRHLVAAATSTAA
jgi:hypothetical protein